MSDAAQIEQTLRQVLPAEHQALVVPIAAILAAVRSGTLDEEAARERARALPGLEQAGQALVSFAGSQTGDVHIGAAAGRDIVTLYQTVFLQQGKGAATTFYGDYVLPPIYIERHQLLAQVRERLIGGQELMSAIHARVRRPLVLHGMGGIGKTVLARAICDDPDIRGAFPDGIFWVTLGQQPELLRPLRAMVEQLGGIVSDHAPTPRGLKAQLSGLLEHKACLVVADDLWHKENADLLRVGGPHCQLLVTTRDSALTEGLGAQVLPVPTMDLDQARRLLCEWADGATADVVESLLDQLIWRLGALPLALKLAGSQLRRTTVPRWLDVFEFRKLRDRRPTHVHDSLELTFGLSLEMLGSERHLYTALGIFSREEAIPQSAIVRLWSGLAGLDEQESTELLDDLAARALVDLILVDGQRMLSLHALLRDLLVIQLEDEAGHTAHQALLSAYRASASDIHWSAIADDTYLYDHLVGHLGAVQAYDEIIGIFSDQRWMRARFQQRSYSYEGYIEDLDAALLLTRARLEAGIEREDLAALSDLFRLLLIRTSINSLVFNYSPALVRRAVELGIWSLDQALAIARRVTSMSQSIRFCQYLLEQLPADDERRQTLIELVFRKLRQDGSLEPPGDLSALGPHLSEVQLNEALSFASRCNEPYAYTKLTCGLAEHFPEGQRELVFQKVLDSTAHISTELLQVRCLEVIVDKAPPGVVKAAVAIAASIRHPSLRATALKGLHKQLPEETKPLVEQLAREACLRLDSDDYAIALVTLGRHLEGEEQQRIVETLIDIAQQPREERARYNLLHSLALWVNGPAQERVLQIILGHEQTNHKVDCLIQFAESGDETLRCQLRAVVPTLPSATHQARLLVALATKTPEAARGELLTEAVAAILRLPSDEGWLFVLGRDLAPCLSTEALVPLMRRVMRSIFTARIYWREETLRVLAPLLDAELLQEVLRNARKIPDGGQRVTPLLVLATHLTADEQRQMIATTLKARLGDTLRFGLVRSLTLLSPLMAQEQREHVLTTLLEEPVQSDYLRALSLLVPNWEGPLTMQFVDAAFEMLHSLEDPNKDFDLMGQLVQTGAVPLGRRILLTARRLPDLAKRVNLYSMILGLHMGRVGHTALSVIIQNSTTPDASGQTTLEDDATGECSVEQLVGETLAEAAACPPTYWAVVLRSAIASAPYDLRQPLLDHYMLLLETISTPTERFSALQSIFAYLQPSQIDRALDVALTFQEDGYRAQLIWQIAHLLTPEQFDRSMKCVTASPDAEFRALLLAHLATCLSGEIAVFTHRDAVAAAEAAFEETGRARALAEVATYGPEDTKLVLLQRAVERARTLESPVCRASALCTLAERLPDQARLSVLSEAAAVAAQLPTEQVRLQIEVFTAYAHIAPLQALQYIAAMPREQSRVQLLKEIIRHSNSQDTAQLLPSIEALSADQDKARSIQILAAYSNPVRITELLPLVKAIKHPRTRADTWRVIVDVTSDLETTERKAILLAFTAMLCDCATYERSQLLTVVAAANAAFTRMVPSTISAMLIAHIIEVCEQWEWL